MVGGKQPPILVLSEDGSSHAVSSITALLEILLREILGQKDLHIYPDPVEKSLRQILSGNKWKSQSQQDQQHIISLRRTIAAHLRRPNGYVFFHFDGDTKYSKRSKSENITKFQKQIVEPVRQLLQITPAQRLAASQSSTFVLPEEADVAIARLIPLTPFYCIESWAYYNNRLLQSIADKADIPTIEKWEEDPSVIEEIIMPFNQIPSVYKNRNLDLFSSAYPVSVGIDCQKSLLDTAELLKTKTVLLALLGIESSIPSL